LLFYIFSRKIIVFEKNLYSFVIFGNNDRVIRIKFYPSAARSIKGFFRGMSFCLIHGIMD